MNGPAFPALGSQVSVSVACAGSYLPDHRVSNQEILQYLRPARPDGRLLEPEWVVKHLGIYERRLDYEFGGGASAAGPMVASTMATWRWRRHARLSAMPASALVR